MTLVEKIKHADHRVTRVRMTSAGLVIEVNGIGQDAVFAKQMLGQLGRIAWEDNEIVYSIYVFTTEAERFSVEAILRENRSEYSFNMSTSITDVNDIYCRFTKFDFDVLTLADRDEQLEGLFVIDATSLCKDPVIEYQELDIMGHQFPISSRARRVNGWYAITLAATELRW